MYVLFTYLADIISFPENLTLPVGSNGTFTCKSNSTIIWIVRNDVTTLYFMTTAPSFITFSPKGPGYISQLTLPGELSNNFTTVGCVATHTDIGHFFTNSGRAATFKLYG